MAMLATLCALALQADAALVCTVAADEYCHSSFVESAMPDNELATIYGTGLPEAGLDQVGPASAARFVNVAIEAPLTSQQTREVVDNWNVQVASLLIADAITRARP